jgi:hypothetical protein
MLIITLTGNEKAQNLIKFENLEPGSKNLNSSLFKKVIN